MVVKAKRVLLMIFGHALYPSTQPKRGKLSALNFGPLALEGQNRHFATPHSRTLGSPGSILRAHPDPHALPQLTLPLSLTSLSLNSHTLSDELALSSQILPKKILSSNSGTRYRFGRPFRPWLRHFLSKTIGPQLVHTSPIRILPGLLTSIPTPADRREPPRSRKSPRRCRSDRPFSPVRASSSSAQSGSGPAQSSSSAQQQPVHLPTSRGLVCPTSAQFGPTTDPDPSGPIRPSSA
ncbi:hypothetical protein CRG98_034639 [Punica granatum]|uniref:Uncharacterized protein n=1 Tax=Punica granatum TaxID=22663 RepID=A0A2I0ILR3_PUNGR|nr:hypothetical protein CRG98_034639 [Punica granatum]